MENGCPADQTRDYGSEEHGRRLSRVAHSIDTESRPLCVRWEPFGYESDARRKGRSRHTEEKARSDQQRVRARHWHQQRGGGRQNEDRGEDEPPT